MTPTPEEKDRIIHRLITEEGPEGHLMLADLMCGLPLASRQEYRRRARPIKAKAFRDDAIEILATPLIWYMQLKGVPVYTWFQRHGYTR